MKLEHRIGISGTGRPERNIGEREAGKEYRGAGGRKGISGCGRLERNIGAREAGNERREAFWAHALVHAGSLGIAPDIPMSAWPARKGLAAGTGESAAGGEAALRAEGGAPRREMLMLPRQIAAGFGFRQRRCRRGRKGGLHRPRADRQQ